MSVSALSFGFRSLSDVWTNHLLPFLLPNVLRMRKHMSITLYEMMIRMDMYKRWDGYRDLCLKCRCRSFWLNDHVAVLVDPLLGPYHYLLHLSDAGIVHCSIRVHIDRSSARIRSTYCRFSNLLIDLDVATLERVRYYRRGSDHRWWVRMYDQELIRTCSQSNEPCIKRAYTLYSIRHKNR
jgi:hypothetical protein